MNTSRAKDVCFVCGSVGSCNYPLHTRARDKGSYFPFLEHHDPPKRARIPDDSGIVYSCRVCYSFLNQQWDSYERSKTPAIKRLYWLKRSDNGHFTGAEMRIQGEYAAQVMGLQYTPGSTCGYEGFDGFPVQQPVTSPGSTCSGYSVYNTPQKMKVEKVETNGVLDLSVPTEKTAPMPALMRERERQIGDNGKGVPSSKGEPSIICYVCAMDTPENLARFICSKRTAEDEPYFPFLEKMKPPRGAMPLTVQGLTRVCSSCRTTLSRQWKTYDSSGIAEENRIYRINDEPIAHILGQPEHHLEPVAPHLISDTGPQETMDFQEVCYLCSQVYHKDSMKLLYTRPPDGSSKHSMYFPFVAQLQKPSSARTMDAEGRVLSCRACYSYLQRQWQTYQMDGTPHRERQFVLRPVTAVHGKLDGKSPSVSHSLAANRSSNNCPSSASESSRSCPPSSVKQPLNIQIASASPIPLVGGPAQGLLAIAPSAATVAGTVVAAPMCSVYPFTSPAALSLASGAGSSAVNTAVSTSTSAAWQLNLPTADNVKQEPKLTTGESLTVVKGKVSETGSHSRDNRSKHNQVNSVYCYVCGFKCTGGHYYNLPLYPKKKKVPTATLR